MISEDTALPCPYARLIVGTRHCRVLISGNINSDVTGIDINLSLKAKVEQVVGPVADNGATSQLKPTVESDIKS
ncbi:hypothetical protein [Microcoleus sp. SVA1_A1]|uniref:hypothetical protein n=1 Tax=Microcoleus sp. SVA1_A1 TaxID=2818946 RepID=UPI002FD4E395